MLRPVAIRRCSAAKNRRTAGITATLLAPCDTSGVRISPLTSSPLSTTRPGGISIRTSASADSTAAASSTLTPRRCIASATARYIAPVSRYSKPSRAASAFVTVLFPTPEGPSTVTIMGAQNAERGIQSRRRPGVFRSELRVPRFSELLDPQRDGFLVLDDAAYGRSAGLQQLVCELAGRHFDFDLGVRCHPIRFLVHDN